MKDKPWTGRKYTRCVLQRTFNKQKKKKKKRIYKENSVISQPAKFKNGHDMNRQVTNEDV